MHPQPTQCLSWEPSQNATKTPHDKSPIIHITHRSLRLKPIPLPHHLLPRQHLHRPTQQPPQLGRNDLGLLLLLLPRVVLFRRRLGRRRTTGIRARRRPGARLPRLRLRGGLGRLARPQPRRRGKVALLVNGLDKAVEALEEGLGADEGRFEVDGAGEFVYFSVVSVLVGILPKGEGGGAYHISGPRQSASDAS